MLSTTLMLTLTQTLIFTSNLSGYMILSLTITPNLMLSITLKLTLTPTLTLILTSKPRTKPNFNVNPKTIAPTQMLTLAAILMLDIESTILETRFVVSLTIESLLCIKPINK